MRLRKIASTLQRSRAAAATSGDEDDTGGSQLDYLIPPEIRDDAFADAIEEIAATVGVREILEIGSSAGDGSTAAWVRGARRNETTPRLHCVEVSVERYAALVNRWAGESFVQCHNVSSVPLERFPTPDDVAQFYDDVPSPLREFGLDIVLGWLEQDVTYLREHGLSRDGISEIKLQEGIDTFDAVLIDGSEFTGSAELDEVYGARFVLLDDTETFKNWQNTRRLTADSRYRIVARDPSIRNGFAVFERID